MSACVRLNCFILQLFSYHQLCAANNTALLVCVCKSTGRVASCVEATLFDVSLIQHGEPAGVCIHTSITVSVKTLMVRCHWPRRATPSIPDEDEVNRKSIGLWHWQPPAQRAETESPRRLATLSPVPACALYLLMRANRCFYAVCKEIILIKCADNLPTILKFIWCPHKHSIFYDL